MRIFVVNNRSIFLAISLAQDKGEMGFIPQGIKKTWDAVLVVSNGWPIYITKIYHIYHTFLLETFYIFLSLSIDYNALFPSPFLSLTRREMTGGIGQKEVWLATYQSIIYKTRVRHTQKKIKGGRFGGKRGTLVLKTGSHFNVIE